MPNAPLSDGPSSQWTVAQGNHVMHDAVRDLDGISLALFGWFNHAASLPCRGGRAKNTFQSSPLPKNGFPSISAPGILKVQVVRFVL